MSATTVWIAPLSAALAATAALVFWWSARRQRARLAQTVAHEKLARERGWAYRGGRRAEPRFSFVGKLATNVWEITGDSAAAGGPSDQIVFAMAELAAPHLRLQIVGHAAYTRGGGRVDGDSHSSMSPAPIGSAELRGRFVALCDDPTGFVRVLDDEVEALLLRWPRVAGATVPADDAFDLRWDERGLRIAIRGLSADAANIAQLAELGFAVAGRLAAIGHGAGVGPARLSGRLCAAK